MPDELEERLKSHARAFDSLLSLIPANLYYGGDVSDQWQRKKQTPEQKRAAKMAKLDPDNWKSAKDLMDERAAAAALKRKRDDNEDAESVESADDDMSGLEQPKAIQDAQAGASKKRKTEGHNAPQSEKVKDATELKPTGETEEDSRRRKAELKAARRERKKERKAKAKEKLERQKARKMDGKQQVHGIETTTTSQKKAPKEELQLKEPITLDEPTPASTDKPADAVEETSKEEDEVSVASSDADHSEVFSPQHESGTSSISSIQAPAPEETVKPQSKVEPKPKPQTQAEPETQQQSSNRQQQQPTSTQTNTNTAQTPRERLQAAISQLRAERKADGPDGRAPKNRQELLEQRRRKEEERKAAKKEQKRREKEEEARRQDEEIARRFSPGGSGSLLASPRSPPTSNASDNFNFSYGRIAFEDGTNLKLLDPNTPEVVEEHKKKGPRDPASALKVALAKKERLATLDEQKRAEIEQKDMWLNAKKRAHGEHVKDDTSLLKKALKRQQGQKRKSEREWNERLEGVQKAQEARQKKRTENLAKRKEEKGVKSAGPHKKKEKKVKRPGFEGSFKGRTGGKKK
ncbi:hypothetical protein KCU88_g1117, partial [Aureobasidium melanogenum]